jgi:hypothetical protein
MQRDNPFQARRFILNFWMRRALPSLGPRAWLLRLSAFWELWWLGRSKPNRGTDENPALNARRRIHGGLPRTYNGNLPDDVTYVKTLLYMVRPEDGGPSGSDELRACDPRFISRDYSALIAQILKFQTAHVNKIAGEEKAHGRVMPKSNTLRVLEQKASAEEDARRNDAAIAQVLIAMQTRQALQEEADSVKPDGDRLDLTGYFSKILSRVSPIKLVSNSSKSVSVGVFGAMLANFEFQQGSESRTYSLYSAGLGKSFAAADVAWSTPDNTTIPVGGRVYKGFFRDGVSLDDLAGWCVIYSMGETSQIGFGGSLSIYCLGLPAWAAAFGQFAFLAARGFLITLGTQQGSPDASVSGQVGWMGIHCAGKMCKGAPQKFVRPKVRSIGMGRSFDVQCKSA